MKKWKTLSSKIAFDNPWLKVRQDDIELPNGKILDEFLTWLEGDVAFIVPVTEDNHIILVKQYKHGAGDIVIEFPAGYIGQNERPEEAARRELLEETGYEAKKITKLFEAYNNPTKVVGKYYFYLAQDCFMSQDTSHHPDETENIEVIKKSFKEVFDMLVTNEINASSSIAAGFMALWKLKYKEVDV